MDINEVSMRRYEEGEHFVLAGSAANRILDALADHFRLRREVESLRRSISPASIGPFRARLLDKKVIELDNENKVNAYAWRREELGEHLDFESDEAWLSSAEGDDQFAQPAFNVEELLDVRDVAPHGVHLHAIGSDNPIVMLVPYITNHGDEVYLFHLVHRRFMARIGTSASVIDAHERWDYDEWDEVEIAGGAAQVLTGGMSSTSSGKSARNIFELTHSDSHENATSTDPDPVGYEPSPEFKRRLRVPEDAIVTMFQVLDVTSGESSFWFDRPNPAQTYCPAQEEEE